MIEFIDKILPKEFDQLTRDKIDIEFIIAEIVFIVQQFL